MTDDLYELRPRTVRAWRLTWSNWQELADKTGGQFHQSLQLDRSAMRSYMPNSGRAYLSVPVQDKFEVCKVGDWVVEEQAGQYAVWNQVEFEETFRPAPVVVQVYTPQVVIGVPIPPPIDGSQDY